MAAPEICRICLAFEVKLYEYDRYELKKFYEQFMASKIDEDECLPRYFCYECAAMLHKFHKFKEKCYNGEKVLRKLMYNGPITTKLISNLDRETIKLQSPLSLIMVNHRVRTYVVKSKPKPLITAVATENVLETSSIPDDNDYADVFDDKDDFPPLPEVVSVNETMVDKMVHLDVDNEQIHIKKEKTPPVESVIDTEKVITPDERLLTEDEIIFTNDVKETVDDTESMAKEAEAVLEKKKNQAKDNIKKREGAEVLEVNKKVKKFEIKKKKETELDSNNWSKFNLSEEQAVEEFKARAQHKRFISAKYKCNDCLKGFSKEDMLSRHVKKKHSESIGEIECRFCRTRFKLKCFLTRHIREHYTKYKCLRCDLVCPLLSTALFHEQYHNGVIRKCAHCGEEFKHLSTYYTHLRTHRSEHVCTICGASFVSAVGLNLHKKIKHIDTTSITEGAQGEDEYCKHCDIRFETKKAYAEHLIHSAKHVDGIKDLEVQAPLGTIRNPKKRRSNPKSISVDCYICGKNFLTQAARRKHHLAEHPRQSMIAPNERQICEICGVSLVPGSVSSHLNTHTKKKLYTCNTCGRQFNSKCGMTKHLLSHSSEKPVACTLCDKRFKEVSSMKLHYRTFHLKEPYPKRNRNKKSADISMLNDYVKNLMTT